MAKEYCDFCDGCGWYEGGPTLMTTCEKCNGTGIVDKYTPSCTSTVEQFVPATPCTVTVPPVSDGFEVKTYRNMESFKERLLIEEKDLHDKILKLQVFLTSEKFDTLDELNKALLTIQFSAMETYYQCLIHRIERE